jgi:hypothetical protein
MATASIAASIINFLIPLLLFLSTRQDGLASKTVTLCNKFERNAAFSTDKSSETLPVAAMGLVASDIWTDEITFGVKAPLTPSQALHQKSALTKLQSLNQKYKGLQALRQNSM